ncbi:DNA cytosine methyltransferase [Phocaeicola dorei]|nr:DNA cytosine methyltransferase [Phocaeicola dorei]
MSHFPEDGVWQADTQGIRRVGSIAEPRKNIQQLEPRTDGKTNCLTSVQKDNLIWVGLAGCRPDRKGKTGTCSQNPLPFGEICMSCGRIRRLTPTECARLQTIPEWYQWKCSDTQQYRMLGNGWTVEVIVHIFSFLKDNIHINIAWQQA